MKPTGSLIAILATFSLLLAGSAQAQDLPLPTEWSTHYAWFLEANPEYERESASADSIITANHIQYQLRLAEEGKSIVAGGLGRLEGDATVGLTILRASSRSEALEIAEGDPAVQSGRLKVVIREWWVPTSQLK